MAHEAWVNIIQPGQALVDRIVKTGGPARQAFLENEIIFPQLLFQETRPALIFIETAVIRSTVPVGIGISVAYNVFFHDVLLLND